MDKAEQLKKLEEEMAADATLQLKTNLVFGEGDITNIVKRRPPNNRDPLPEEIAAYKPYLTRQIEIINPKIIATLGRFSMNYFNEKLKISVDHGKIFRMNGRPSTDGRASPERAGRLLIPLYHPAAILRNMGLIGEYEKDFRKLPKTLSKFDELVKKS